MPSAATVARPPHHSTVPAVPPGRCGRSMDGNDRPPFCARVAAGSPAARCCEARCSPRCCWPRCCWPRGRGTWPFLTAAPLRADVLDGIASPPGLSGPACAGPVWSYYLLYPERSCAHPPVPKRPCWRPVLARRAAAAAEEGTRGIPRVSRDSEIAWCPGRRSPGTPRPAGSLSSLSSHRTRALLHRVVCPLETGPEGHAGRVRQTGVYGRLPGKPRHTGKH